MFDLPAAVAPSVPRAEDGRRMRFAFVDDWPHRPDGLVIGDVGGVAVGPDDRVYVFHRGPAPLLVFDRDGRLLDAWGDGLFTSPHGLHVGWDGTLLCTDDGDHTVKRFDTRGRLLQEIGTRSRPSGFMSGEPFNRCTHAALLSNGDIVVTDGYRNACVHRFAADGTHRATWGRCGSLPGEFYVPHDVACDADDRLYVADRENHRIQVFDASGRFLAQWGGLHRPMGLAAHACDDGHVWYVCEAPPLFNASFPGLGPRISVLDACGRVIDRIADVGHGHAPDRFVAPHGIAVDSRGDLYVGEVARAAWPSLYPGVAIPDDLRTLRKLRRVRSDP